MKRLFAVLTILAAASLPSSSQNVNDVHRKIVELVDSHDYPAAIIELEGLKKSDIKEFESKNYDYLLARAAEADGQLALAMSNYQSVKSRDSVLSAYALGHMAQISRSTGNLNLERLYLQEMLLLSADSLLITSANDRLARNSFERGNFTETIRLLTSRSPGVTNSQTTKPAGSGYSREIQVLLGKAYLESGQTPAAREIFAALIDRLPNPTQPDDVAQTAVNALDLMDGGGENFGKTAPDLSESEHMRRANIYQFNRDFANAKLHYEAILGTFPNSPSAAEASYQIGRGYAQLGNFVEALTWYERVQEQYPQSPPAKDALLQAAAGYSRVGKAREAIKRYQKYIDKYPDDQRLDRAYMNIVDIYRDLGEDQEAFKWCAKAEGSFKGKVTEAVAIFAEARIYIVKEDWQNALANLERLRSFPDLGGAAIPGGTGAPEVNFLKGFALEQMKRYAEAIDLYLSIADGRNEYYGLRSTQRLREMSKDQTAGSYISQKIGSLSTGLKSKDADERRQNAQNLLRLTETPDVREKALGVLKTAVKALPKYSAVPNYKLLTKAIKDPTVAGSPIADRLRFLGLMDEAVPESEAAAPNVARASDDNAFTLASDYLRGDRGDKAIAFMEPVWKKVPPDYPIELIPRRQLEMLYPAVYQYSLLHYAPGRQVDPRLILAIMRQEARFQPDAKSYAAARGLLQFIATTSTRISAELGRESFAQDELYYPPTATLFGAQYLSDLFKIFPGQTEAVAASYNGGDDNMKRWLARARSNLPERYVPEIMFGQSKDYVYKVMANYRMYQLLYDQDLRPH